MKTRVLSDRPPQPASEPAPVFGARTAAGIGRAPAADKARGDSVIRVENLVAAYGEQVVLSDVTFDVRRGERFVIAGGSGVGKSTLLKHLIGLYKPASGRVLIDGDDIATAEGRDLERVIRKFGIAYQGGPLFGSMSLL